LHGNSALLPERAFSLPFGEPFDKLRRGLRMSGSKVIDDLFVAGFLAPYGR
jgi:hypothetical protein